MTRIFPEARDYKTVNLKISAAQRKNIETAIGYKLLPGQQDQFQYFEMTGEGGKRVGYTIAASQKGEFGAIEFVVGLDTNLVVKDLYIQRSRERDQTFKDRSFLDLFKGRKVHKWQEFSSLYTGKETPGTTAVVKGIIKEFATYKELVLSKS